ncbi:MAG: type II toxin-antitoxin system RelE/ParE family toxin [Candidatus Desulfofervidaceae bacterium]|nr:type II toxin-antitoxin system RelE/ParE family toxin [Candidatus Desulfofervidaceae bacterium]
MRYKVVIHKRVVKYLNRLSLKEKELIKDSLKKLEKGKFEELKVKKMYGEWEGYRRFKIGNKRVIFWLEEEEKVIYVDYIGARGDIYKK